MAINEIFKNPTVKTVIFQIRFPNLFFIEKIIGDFQVKMMDKFPNSSLILKKGIVVSVGATVPGPADIGDESAMKIWQFDSGKGFKLSVQTNSLDIVSEHHKTYMMEGADKFRDIIKFSLDNFLSIVPVPVINRIGLRYIDHCPIVKKDNSTFLQYYHSVFPLERFSLETANEMRFATTVVKGKYLLTYMEALQKEEKKYKLILDFDGYALKVKPQDYLSVTDNLHTLISDTFEETIKEPLKEYMRK